MVEHIKSLLARIFLLGFWFHQMHAAMLDFCLNAQQTSICVNMGFETLFSPCCSHWNRDLSVSGL